MLFHILLSLTLVFAASKSPKKIKPLGSELIKQSKASDWRSLDPEKTLYMELPSGRVVIELFEEIAPKHFKNIKQLVVNKYFDGLMVYRSQDNYVAQWGAPEDNVFPDNSPKLKNTLKKIPAEFEVKAIKLKGFTSIGKNDVYAPEVGFYKGFPVGTDGNYTWQLHCYGAIGVSRGMDINGGNGTALYMVTGHSPRHLDRNITLVGQAVYGMEHLSSLPRGKGAMGFYKDKKKYVKIKRISIASQVPKAQQTPLELLRTDTKIFKDYLEARKNRQEKWFYRPAEAISICNIPSVTRLKK